MVGTAYERAGIKLSDSKNSRAQYQYCKDNNLLIDKSELQPGDLIFWEKDDKIAHVGIYVGDYSGKKNQIIDAGNPGVTVRNMWEGAGFTLSGYAHPW